MKGREFNFRFLLSYLLLAFLFILSSCQVGKLETNMSSKLEDFEFLSQDEEIIGLKDLKGKWWLAYFLYTDCKLVCPTTTPNMAKVQKDLKDLGLDVEIIAFTVDPDKDYPAVLKEYASQYDLDLSNWHFLTGYDFDEIKKLSNESFQTVLERGGPTDHAFAHSTAFFLVNPKGVVIKRYDGMSLKEAENIVQDLKNLR